MHRSQRKPALLVFWRRGIKNREETKDILEQEQIRTEPGRWRQEEGRGEREKRHTLYAMTAPDSRKQAYKDKKRHSSKTSNGKRIFSRPLNSSCDYSRVLWKNLVLFESPWVKVWEGEGKEGASVPALVPNLEHQGTCWHYCTWKEKKDRASTILGVCSQQLRESLPEEDANTTLKEASHLWMLSMPLTAKQSHTARAKPVPCSYRRVSMCPENCYDHKQGSFKV